MSPCANYIVADLNGTVLIKMLNQVNKEQSSNLYSYHISIPFMPLYLDEDYNYLVNKQKFENEFDDSDSSHIKTGKFTIR